MYPASLLSLVYYVLMVSIHYFAPAERKVFSQLGISCALISTATIVIDYFLQLSVIQPSVVLGETDGIALLSQFNPHGVFIVLEEIGFLMMSLSMLFMAPAIVGNTKVEKANPLAVCRLLCAQRYLLWPVCRVLWHPPGIPLRAHNDLHQLADAHYNQRAVEHYVQESAGSLSGQTEGRSFSTGRVVILLPSEPGKHERQQ